MQPFVKYFIAKSITLHLTWSWMWASNSTTR